MNKKFKKPITMTFRITFDLATMSKEEATKKYLYELHDSILRQIKFYLLSRGYENPDYVKDCKTGRFRKL